MAYDIIIGRTEEDRKKFGDKGTIFLGRSYVKMGATTSLSNRILMDVARSHVVLVAGKRGCLTGDTKVFTNHGFKDIKCFDKDKDLIYSYDKNKQKFKWQKAKLLRYPINNESLIKFELHDGQSITSTKEHPLLILNKGGGKIWKSAKNITKEDKIIAITKVPEVKNDKESVRIARLLGFILADGNLSVWEGRWKDGRGYWYNGIRHRIRIFNDCKEVLITAKKDFEEEFCVPIKRYKRNDCNCEVIQTQRASIVKKFIRLGVPIGNKSKIIRVPQVVWESSNKFKANFLKALFSCDGYIDKRGTIEYYSNSKNFLLDLHYLLSHFHIQSKIREKKVKCNKKRFISYALSMWDYNSTQNFKKIGFFNKMSLQRLYGRKFWRMKRRKKTIYLDDNLFGASIKNISEVSRINEVFDLTVPKNHSFIANGIISHNSGKSYSLSVMAEEMTRLPHEIKKNLSMLFFDTMGIFWTMKYPNERQEGLLKKWGMEPEGFDVEVYVPQGSFEEYQERGLPVDHSFTIKTSELSSGDWCGVFEVSPIDPMGILIDRIIGELKEYNEDYDIIDIVRRIKIDKRSDKNTKDAVESRFLAAQKWGLFSREGTKTSELIKPGKATIIDISAYREVGGAWSIKGLVIGLICKKLLFERIISRKSEELEAVEKGSKYFGGEEKEELPLIWVFIDEGHEFLPKGGKNPATDALIQLLREGRQPGISMVIATQQPGEIARDVMTQSDIILSHRVTAKADIEALNSIMQTYLLNDIQGYLNNLPGGKGSAIILDDNSERIYPMCVRPKLSWHGGETPTSVKIKKREELELL